MFIVLANSLPFALIGKKIKSAMSDIAMIVIFNYGNKPQKKTNARGRIF